MGTIARVQKQNAVFRRLHDLQTEAIKKVTGYKITEVNRSIREINKCLSDKDSTCKRCLRRKMEPCHKMQRLSVSTLDDNKLDGIDNRPSDCDGCKEGGKHGQCRRREHTERRNCKHSLHICHQKSAQTSLPKGYANSSNQEIKETNESLGTCTGENSNKNITAFMFSRHCRHGYDMKKTSDDKEDSVEYMRKKIRAKVVKNYLLQDVFKRLSATRSNVVRNTVDDSVDSSNKSVLPDTVQTLAKCRYLRMPHRQTRRSHSQHNDGDSLTNVDVL